MPNSVLPHFNRNSLGSDVSLLLRAARKKKALNRAQLAQKANIAPHTLARIERGDQKPRRETLQALADALGVQLESLATTWKEDERRRRDHPDHLGRGLRNVRQRAGVSLADAAVAAGVDPSTLSRFERMQTDSLLISLDGVTFVSAKLARILGFNSVDDLSAACSDFYS